VETKFPSNSVQREKEIAAERISARLSPLEREVEGKGRQEFQNGETVEISGAAWQTTCPLLFWGRILRNTTSRSAY
jgi:hypothetical protein